MGRVMLIDGHPLLEDDLIESLTHKSAVDATALRASVAALKPGERLTIAVAPRVIEVADPADVGCRRVMLLDACPLSEEALLEGLTSGAPPEHVAQFRTAIAALKLGDRMVIEAAPRVVELAPPGVRPSCKRFLNFKDDYADQYFRAKDPSP